MSMQTEYMGTRKSKIILHRVVMDVEKYLVETFTNDGKVEEVSSEKTEGALPPGK